MPETCPVCDHSPISPDLCKPNKALRTTLKAFLRTEEKKREKERPPAAPASPSTQTPTESVDKQTDAAPSAAADVQAETEETAPEPPPGAGASTEDVAEQGDEADGKSQVRLEVLTTIMAGADIYRDPGTPRGQVPS